MYYTLSIGGFVKDVFESPLPYVHYDTAAKRVLFCGENDNPSGVSSVRIGDYFQVSGWTPFPSAVQAETATLTEVSHSTYITEKNRLDLEQKTIAELSTAVAKNTTDISYNQSVVDYNIMMGKLDDPEEEE